MKEIGYTSVNRIFSKLHRDLGIDDFHEADAVEWTAEALEAMDAVTMLEESVAFLEVKNFQVQLPKYLDSIIQIARNTEWQEGSDNTCCAPIEIVDALSTPCDELPCEGVKCIPVDETGTPIYTADLYEYKPNINIIAEYFNWVSSAYYINKWVPVRLKNHTFFNSIVCQEVEANDIYQSCRDEYTIVGDRVLRLSFKTGYIAVAYTRQMLDDDGYPMIPDHYSYVTAVTKYITMKLMERQWYSGREGYERKVQKAEADWQWYCKQAGNRAIMPKGLDQYQNMLDTSQYLLPRMHRYNQFFSGLSTMENRVYNDPDKRNTHNRR